MTARLGKLRGVRDSGFGNVGPKACGTYAQSKATREFADARAAFCDKNC
jgi:hypothetical protein